MKKILLTLSAVATLVACSKDEIVDVSALSPIAFGEAFIENSTRVPIDDSHTMSTLRLFEVYGTITNSSQQTANIFCQQAVTSTDGQTWSYSDQNKQYWIPGNTYNFTAIAEGNIESKVDVVTGANNMPTLINLVDASVQKDILYAKSNPISYTSGPMNPVAFTFSHILSKAMFTVKNGISTDNGYSYKIGDVRISDAVKEADYEIASGQWKDHANAYILSFGNIVADNVNPALANAVMAEIDFGKSLKSNYERLLIPSAAGGNTSITVLFDYYLYKDDVLIQTIEDKSLSAVVELKTGNAYNFQITLPNPGDPIQFSVTAINGWLNGNTTDTSDPADGVNDVTPIP